MQVQVREMGTPGGNSKSGVSSFGEQMEVAAPSKQQQHTGAGTGMEGEELGSSQPLPIGRDTLQIVEVGH